MSTNPVQKGHGHSPIAHPILEALALADMAAGELKVVLAVIRETYGWSRKAAPLSLAQLAAATGCHKNTVQRSVRSLLKEGVLVEVTPATFTEPATLGLQKDPRQWGRYAATPPSLSGGTPHLRALSPSVGGVTGDGNTPVTVDGNTHTSQVDGPQSVTEPENKLKQTTPPLVPRKRGSDEEPEGFADAWDRYPKRAGGNPKAPARKAWRARLREGTTPDELIRGVERYAAYVRATEREGTEFVKQAATFFGPGGHWSEDYPLPSSPNGRARASPAYYSNGSGNYGLPPVILDD